VDTLHLFIDTNVFLSFYAFTNDDVEQLRKLTKLIQKKKLVLYITEQVRDEFYRNREQKIAESLGAFRKKEIGKTFPRYMADYPEADAFKLAAADMEKARDALATRATKDAKEKLLAADTLFAEILAVAGPIKVSDEIVVRANRRRIRGNPPGKENSFGDQINWECLLEAVPDGTDLNVVSKDGDYASKLDDAIRPFLADEWENRKSGSIKLHAEIKPFLNSSFPTIKLAIDVEKQIAVDRLIQSGSFSTTHEAIAELQLYLDAITWDDADAILVAGIANNQIAWIGTDYDVATFYRALIEKFETKLLDERIAELKALFKTDPFEEYAATVQSDPFADDIDPFADNEAPPF